MLSSVPLYIVPLLNGLSWAAILIIIAIGLTLIFGFMEVLNFAHGAYYVAGGYAMFTVSGATGSFFLGVLAAIVVGLVLGALTELLVLRPSYESGEITQVIILLGLTLVIEAALILIYGPNNKTVVIPDLLAGSVGFMGVEYSLYRLFLIGVGALVVAATWLFLTYSRVGLVVRASLTDKTMARALGNDIPRIYTGVFAGGIALTAMGGALIMPVFNIGPLDGLEILLWAFVVVVVGGLGSFRGTVLAGLIIGVTDTLIANTVSFRLSGITMFVILILVLIVRPHGLFGEEGVV